MTSLFFVSLFLQFLQEGQQERHRDAEGEAIGDGLAQLNAAQAPDAGQGEDERDETDALTAAGEEGGRPDLPMDWNIIFVTMMTGCKNMATH